MGRSFSFDLPNMANFAIIRNLNERTTSLKEKADKAYHSIVSKSKEWQGFNLKTFFHMFDHTILLIVNYGAEIWDGNKWSAPFTCM